MSQEHLEKTNHSPFDTQSEKDPLSAEILALRRAIKALTVELSEEKIRLVAQNLKDFFFSSSASRILPPEVLTPAKVNPDENLILYLHHPHGKEINEISPPFDPYLGIVCQREPFFRYQTCPLGQVDNLGWVPSQEENLSLAIFYPDPRLRRVIPFGHFLRKIDPKTEQKGVSEDQTEQERKLTSLIMERSIQLGNKLHYGESHLIAKRIITAANNKDESLLALKTPKECSLEKDELIVFFLYPEDSSTGSNSTQVSIELGILMAGKTEKVFFRTMVVGTINQETGQLQLAEMDLKKRELRMADNYSRPAILVVSSVLHHHGQDQ